MRSANARHLFAFIPAAELTRSPHGGSDVTNSRESENSEKFFPGGAIFFFVLLLLLYALIWGIIYWIMIARS